MNSYKSILESLLGILELNKDVDWTQTDVSEEFQAIIEYIKIHMSKVEPLKLFDDIVFDDIGAWSQICKDCLDKYPQLLDQKDITIEDHGLGICGVKGCECDETTYITFERGAE
tara:strand:+ start:612 stop:953 length:342 start_codon:yes stop_codon:yes gene_type:complete